jgi:hypothetical protein
MTSQSDTLLSFAKAYTLMGKDVFAQVFECVDDDTMYNFVKALPTLGINKTNIFEIMKIITEIIVKKVKRVPDSNCDSSSNPIPWTLVENDKTFQLINRSYRIPASILLQLVPSSKSLEYPLKRYLSDGKLVEIESKEEVKEAQAIIPATIIDMKSFDAKTETKTCVQCEMPFPHVSTYICKWMNCICCVTSNIFPYAIIDDNVPTFVDMINGERGQICAAHGSVVEIDSKYSSCASLCMTCRYKRPLACEDCKRTDTKLRQIRPVNAWDSLSDTLYPYEVKFVCVDACSFTNYNCKDCGVPFKTRSRFYLDSTSFHEEAKSRGITNLDNSDAAVIQLKESHYVCRKCAEIGMGKWTSHYICALPTYDIWEPAYNIKCAEK